MIATLQAERKVMKKNFILCMAAIIAVLLLLSGCKAESTDSPQNEVRTENTVQTEDAAQEMPPDMADTDSSGDSDNFEAADMKKMFGEDCIAEQTFEFDLGVDEEKVYFVPFAPSDNNPEFHVQIMQEEKVLYELKQYVPENLKRKKFESLDAVSFWDVNFDGLTDIVMIETYGGTKFAAVYYGYIQEWAKPDQNKFIFWMMDELSETISSQAESLTIAGIRSFLAGGKKNGEFDNYAEAYEAVVTLSEILSEIGYQAEQEYDLIYVDGDNIPELVAGKSGYYVSLYTYHDGAVHMLMDKWGYGVMGNVGYKYSPKKNSIRNYNTDFAGLIHNTYYMEIQEQNYIDVVADIEIYEFDDANNNGMPDEGEAYTFDDSSVKATIYFEDREISDEEYASVLESYDMGGYRYIKGKMCAQELRSTLHTMYELHSVYKEKADNGETESPALADITWEDSETVSDGTVLYFSFTDGTVAAEYIDLGGIVNDIEYQDITGDGIDEVIVSLYFVNTITEYNILYIYQVKNGIAEDISPSSYNTENTIWELRNGVWNMTILQEHDEGYTIVLEMESYDKIPGLGYTDCIMTVGYDGAEWVMLDRWAMPEWNKAYVYYLRYKWAGTYDTGRFALAYVDDDEIPELFCYADDAQAVASVFTYENKRAKEFYEDGVVKEITGLDGQEDFQMAHQIEYENGMDFDELLEMLLKIPGSD